MSLVDSLQSVSVDISILSYLFESIVSCCYLYKGISMAAASKIQDFIRILHSREDPSSRSSDTSHDPVTYDLSPSSNTPKSLS